MFFHLISPMREGAEKSEAKSEVSAISPRRCERTRTIDEGYKEQAMSTTALNTTRQTRPLSKTTHAYEEQELEALLDEINRDGQPEAHSARLLSPEVRTQVLAGSET